MQGVPMAAKKFALFLFSFLILFSGFAFTHSFGAGARVANVTGCSGFTIDSTAVSGNGTSNWTLGANMSTSTPTVFNQSQASGAVCIVITANNITLDLNGSNISLSASVGGTIKGIAMQANNVTIKNGYITGTSGVCEAPCTLAFMGAQANLSSNITLQNMSFVTSIFTQAINISNSSNVLINNVNITNPNGNGIKIENSSFVNMTDVFFATSSGNSWVDGSAAISVTNQNSTQVVNVTNGYFNATNNISLLFNSNLTVSPQLTKPITNGPPGNAVGSTQSYLGWMINISGASTATRANLTFFFSPNRISTYTSDQVSEHYTSDSASWTGVASATFDSNAMLSLTTNNIASFGVYSLFGYIPPGSSSTSTTDSGRGRQIVPPPDITYDPGDNKIRMRTPGDIDGGMGKMEFYCNYAEPACNVPCNGFYDGAYYSSIQDGIASFEYFGPGEYRFAIVDVGSSNIYRPTSGGYDWWKTCFAPKPVDYTPPKLYIHPGIICPAGAITAAITNDSGTVSGAEVTLSKEVNGACDSEKTTVVTATDGKATFDSAAFEVNGNYCIKASKQGQASAFETIPYGSGEYVCKKPGLTVETSSGCPTCNLVVTVKEDGEPKAGVAVSSIPIGTYSLGYPSACQGTTDGNGQLKCCTMPEGSYYVSATDRANGVTGSASVTVGLCAGQEQNKSTGREKETDKTGIEGEDGTVVKSSSYDLVTDPKNEVGREQTATATKDGAACVSCTVIVKSPDGSEAKFTTDAKGQIKFLLPNKGTYVLSLLNDEGNVAKNRDVEVAYSLNALDSLKKLLVLDDPAVRNSLIVIVIVLVALGLYLWKRSQTTKRFKR